MLRRWSVLPKAIAVLAALLVVVGAAWAQRIEGNAKDNRLVGTPRADTLLGKAGADRIRGAGGGDRLRGGVGRDRLKGGKGADQMVGGPGRDGFAMRRGNPKPEPGADVIWARDGGRDEVNCGGGRDKAFVDRVEDGVYDCERVVQP